MADEALTAIRAWLAGDPEATDEVGSWTNAAGAATEQPPTTVQPTTVQPATETTTTADASIRDFLAMVPDSATTAAAATEQPMTATVPLTQHERWIQRSLSEYQQLTVQTSHTTAQPYHLRYLDTTAASSSAAGNSSSTEGNSTAADAEPLTRQPKRFRIRGKTTPSSTSPPRTP